MTGKAEFLPAPPAEEVIYSIPDVDEETLTAADAAAEAAVEQLSSNAEKGKVIRIYRQLGTGQETMEFVAKYPADKYSIDDLIEKMQVEYGGGDYRFMIYNEKGKIAANKLFTIAKKITKTTEENSGLYGLLQGIMDRQDNFSRVLLAKQNEGDSNRMEMLQEMVIMKNLFSSGENSGGNAVAQLKELMEAMNLLKEMGGNNEDSDSGFAGIFKDSIPLLQTIAEAAKQPARSTPGNPGNQTRPAQDKKMDIQSLLNYALKQCQGGLSPKDSAGFICDRLTDAQLSQIEPYIISSDLIDKLIMMEPEAARHKEWFIDLIEWLRGYMGFACKYDSEFKDSEDLTPTNDKNTIDLDEFAKSNTPGNTERESGNPDDT